MSPVVEFEGKNVDQAVSKACEALSISSDLLKYEVISFGASGIFGLVGVKKARIRVIRPDEAPEKKPVPVTTVSEDSTLGGKQFLQRLADAVTSGAEISVNAGDRQIVYTITGGEPAALIGKRGQTIEAMQYLLKKVLNKSAEDRTRIIVEIAGHAQKRQQDLQELALRSAEKACRSGKTVTLGRLNAHDRKIIHLALKQDNRIATQSRGDGHLKKIVIVPQDKNSADSPENRDETPGRA